MIRGEQLTAIIPVRGGSKGIPHKNMLRIGRDTLLDRTIKQALACPQIDRVWVSTDHAEMYAVAASYGVATPQLRPADLAVDTAKTVDVILDALHQTDTTSGYVMLLQVTSPLRTIADITACIETFTNAENAPAIVTLVAHDSPHPDKIQKIEHGVVRSYLGKESMVARQQLPQVYALNGACYLTSVAVLNGQKTFMPPGTIPYVMPAERSVNLDNPMDLFLLECLLQHGKITLEEY